MRAFSAHELAVGDVYFSPLLLVIILAFVAAALTGVLFNRLRLSQYLIYPPLSFIAIMVIYLVMIDHYFIKI
jgi:ABC-type Na+ efflux pump permease subunit